MDDHRSAPGGPFLRNRKSALAAVIEKYSKEDPEEDDIVDIFRECLYEDRGSLTKKTSSECEFSQVLADFVLNSDIDWSSSSSTLASSPSCGSGPKALNQLFVRLTDVGKKLSTPVADVQPSKSKDPFVGCDSDAADGNNDCSRGSSGCCRNCRCHSSSHGKQQQQQQHRQQPQQQQQHEQQQHGQQQQYGQQQQQHGQQQQQYGQQQQQHGQQQQQHGQQQQLQQQQQRDTRQQQLRVEVQSNPYFLLNPSKEQCSAGRSSRSHRGASSSAAAATVARVIVDKPPAVEHEGRSNKCDRRHVVPTDARMSSPVRRTVSSCTESYSFDCRSGAAPPCVSIADGRSSAARAKHSAAGRGPNDCRPKRAERGSTQAVPDSTGTSLGSITDAPSLRSSLPSATEARRPQLPPVSLQEKAGHRSPRQPAKWSTVSAGVVAADHPTLAADHPTLAASAMSAPAGAELRSPGGPITSRSLASLGKLLPGEWIATYLTRYAEVTDRQSPLILPQPSLTPAAAATHNLTGRHPVKGSAVAAETLAAVWTPCNDAFFVAADAGSAEHQPIRSVLAGHTAAHSASGAMHARHSRARRIIDHEAFASSSSCGAGDLRASRAVEAEPSGAAHYEILTPSSSIRATEFGGVQPCRFAPPAVPSATADDCRGSSTAPDHARLRHQRSRVPRDGCDAVLNSSDDDSTVELHRAVVSASSNKVTCMTRATPKRDPGCPDDQTRFGTLHSLHGLTASSPGGLRRAGLAVRSVATLHHPVGHDGRRSDPPADEQSELNRALVEAPDSVEATSWRGRDESPRVGHRRSSLDVASTPLPPAAFLCVEPPPGWRAGDSTPSDKVVGPVLYTPPSAFELHTHSTSTLYTPPSDFGAVRAADVQSPLPPPAEVSGSGRRISRDATPSAKSIPQGRWREPKQLEHWQPCDPFAPLTAVEQKVSGMLRSWNVARKLTACDNGALPQALLYSWTQPNAGQLGRCTCCGGSTPVAAAHAPHLFGAAARCSHGCSSDRT